MDESIDPTLGDNLVQINTLCVPYHNKVGLNKCSTIELIIPRIRMVSSMCSESARSNLLLIVQYTHTLSNDCSISS
jgi:hypothetical protein